VEYRTAAVDSLSRLEDEFVAVAGGQEIRANRVLLATGITDEGPDLPGLDAAVARAVVRYCPVCDGYEAIDKRIAVFGPVHHALTKAVFLRTYTRSVTVLPLANGAIASATSPDPMIGIARHAPSRFRQTAAGIAVKLGSVWHDFDILYAALGCTVHSELGRGLGAVCNEFGNLVTDDKQRTSIEGLYAAGDLVSDLHQLSVAEGHAAVAATSMHNSLPRNFR
jgi:thioredoxin reductase (NADPH)